MSDGARCYPKLAREMKVLLRSVDHSHGVFQKWDRVRGKRLSVHTGGIDQAWKAAKAFIPQSLSTRRNGVVNPLLMKYVRMYQWRFEKGASADFCRETVCRVKNADQWDTCIHGVLRRSWEIKRGKKKRGKKKKKNSNASHVSALSAENGGHVFAARKTS